MNNSNHFLKDHVWISQLRGQKLQNFFSLKYFCMKYYCSCLQKNWQVIFGSQHEIQYAYLFALIIITQCCSKIQNFIGIPIYNWYSKSINLHLLVDKFRLTRLSIMVVYILGTLGAKLELMTINLKSSNVFRQPKS